jgi:hypothetical protein
MRLALALWLVGHAASAREAVLAYQLGNAGPLGAAAVGAEMERELRAHGREVVERPVSRARELRQGTLPPAAQGLGSGRRITVVVDPPDSEVAVDGVVGRELEVGEGEHRVAARHAGCLPDEVVASVGGADLEVHIALATDREQRRIERLSERAGRESLAALARTLALDGIVLIAARYDGRPRVVAQRFTPDGAVTRQVEAPLRELDEAAAFRELAARLEAAPVGERITIFDPPVAAKPAPAAKVEARRATPREERVPFYRKPWMWLGVLVVAVAALAATAAIPTPAPSGTVHVDGKDFAGR